MIRLTLLVFTLFFSSFSLADRYSDAGCGQTSQTTNEQYCPPHVSNNFTIKRSWSPSSWLCSYYRCPISSASDFDDICSQTTNRCNLNGTFYNPEPPPDCPTGWGGTGCDEWEGCPSGTIQSPILRKSCISKPEECASGEYWANEIEGCKSSSCNPKSGSYVGTYSGVHLCDVEKAPNPYDSPNCSDGLPGELSFYSTPDKTVPYVHCPPYDRTKPEEVPPEVEENKCYKGEYLINDKCSPPNEYVKTEEVKRETIEHDDGTKTQVITEQVVQYNEDGSVSIVTEYNTYNTYNSSGELIDTFYSGDSANLTDPEKHGCPTGFQYCNDLPKAPTQGEFGNDKTPDKNKSIVRGGQNCQSTPTCVNADAVSCAILIQTWHTRCETIKVEKQLAEKLAATNSTLDSISDKTETTNDLLSDLLTTSESSNDYLEHLADNSDTSNSLLQSILDGINNLDSSSSGSGSNEGGENQNPCDPSTETCSIDTGVQGSFADMTNEIAAAQSEYDAVFEQIKSSIDDVFSFSLNDEEGGLYCNEVEIFGVEVDISLCRLSDQLSFLKYIFLALAYIIAFRIIIS